MSKQPSDAAMQAARELYIAHWREYGCAPDEQTCASALDAFGEAAVRDEIESIRGWLGVYVSDAVVRQFDDDNKTVDRAEAQLAIAVEALEGIGSYDLRSEEDATYRHVMAVRAALARIRGEKA